MKRLLLYAATSLFAVSVGAPITSAGAVDLRGQPPAAGPLLVRTTPKDVRSRTLIVPQRVIQQASLKTVIRNSSAGPQRYLYTYSPGGKIETERLQCHKSGTWIDSLRTTRTYTPAERLKTEYVEQYLQGAFRSLRRWSIEYNENGDEISSLNEQGGWVLAPVSRTIFEYFSPGKLKYMTIQNWSGDWTNSVRFTYEWDSAGRDVGGTYQEWVQGRWDTTNVTVSRYTGSSIIEETHVSWYKVGGAWSNDSSVWFLRRDDADNIFLAEQKSWTGGVLTYLDRFTNTFDGSMRITRSTTEALVQGVVVPTERLTYTYDHQGNEVKRVREVYSGGAWLPQWQISSSFDGSGTLLSCRSDEWTGGSWVPSTAGIQRDAYASVSIVDAVGNQWRYGQFATLSFDYGTTPTGVRDEQGARPQVWELAQNYPNPFNPTTTIRYGVPERAHVALTVFTMLGEQVAVLYDGEQEAGYHEVRFDAGDLASGVYFYRLKAGNFIETKKLLLTR